MFFKRASLIIFVFILFLSVLPCSANSGFLEGADDEIKTSSNSNDCSENFAGLGQSASFSSSSSKKTTSAYPWKGRVTAGVLNVRSKPWGTIVTQFKRDKVVTITGKSSSDSKWLLLKRSGKTVCVHGAYISKTSGSTSSSSKSSSSSSSGFPFNGKVTASIGLNARKAPWGTKVTSFKYGKVVKVTGRSKSDSKWYAVKHSGSTVYCHSAYISKTSGSVSSSSTGSSGNTTASNPKTGNLSKDILSSMASMESRKLSYPSLCGKTRNGKYYPGWLGCAYAVSKALNMAGVSSYSLGVVNLSGKLQKKPKPGFKKVATSSRKPGDIIIWNNSGHIGVVKGNGRAYSNSSSNGCVREHSDTYMSISYVLRAPA